MDKEELRKQMSKAIGTFENRMVYNISNDCAEIALKYFTEQLNKPLVMQGLPTENDISAAGVNLTEHLETEPMLRDMAKRYFRQGARWAISKLSSSPAVGKAGGNASMSDGK